MRRKKYALVVHKTEWNRLRKATGPPEISAEVVQSEYLKGLVEKSQEWINSWPDTLQGHVLLVNRMKEKKHDKEIALIKSYREHEKQKRGNTEAIQKARQTIFNNTCYGKQLISAILESKVIEERNAQIKLQKEMKQRALELEKKQELKNTLIFASNADENKVREKNKEIAIINKTLHEMNKVKLAEKKKKDQESEREDTKFMKQLLDKKLQKTEPCIDSQIMEQHKADQKKAEERRTRRDKEEDAIISVWRKYQEGIRCKEKRILKQFYQGKNDTKQFKTNYELIEKALEDEKKRYDDFIGKGVDRFEKLNSKKEIINLEKQKQGRQQLLEQVEYNKILAETQKKMRNDNKSIAEEGSLFTKSQKQQRKKMLETEDITEKSQSFLAPSKTLLEQLKQREKAPTPWTGLKGAHAQFAQNASQALRESRYKNMARKVVDNYRKVNCLDNTTLPVSIY